jgi:hypothetical protein
MTWTATIVAIGAGGVFPALALTRTNAFGWIVLAIILLQLGVGVFAVRAALNHGHRAQHRAG